jgi:hypothetical protein
MKYAAEMGSVVMINMPSFIKIGSGIPKSIGDGGYTGKMEIALKEIG